MEVITPKSSSKSKQDRWCEKTLGVRRRGTPKTQVLGEYNFTDDFTPQRLKAIKSDSGRGPFNARLGSFKSVVEQAEKTNQLFTAYKQDTKVKKGGMFSKKSEVSPVEMVKQFEQLIKDAEEWRGHFSEEGQRQKTGIVSDKSVEPDKHRAAKLRACEDLIRGAQVSIAQMKLLELKGKDDNIDEVTNRLQDLRMRFESHGSSQEDMDNTRNLDALLLGQVCGVKFPESGSSEVGLIKNVDGSVAYAFKSIEGESDQTGLPKGAGAVREMMMSRLCDRVREDQNLDFKWPTTSVAKLPGRDGNAKVGVLIEGIPGEEMFDPMAGGVKNIDPIVMQQKTAQSRQKLGKLPPEEIQKLALCNLAFGQYDMKWENCIIQDGGDGATAVPFDGGAAFPDLDLFMDTVNRNAVPGMGLITYGNEELEVMSDGNKVPVGKTPMSPDLVKMFLAIDEKGLLKSALGELKELSGIGLDGKALGMDRGLFIMVKSIQGLKQILKTNPKISLEDFLTAYHKDVMVPLAKDFQEEWSGKVFSQYTELQKKHPDLLPELGDKVTAQSLRNSYLSPEQLKYLDQILTLGGADFLSADPIKVKCPLGSHLSFKWVMTDLVGKRMPAQDKERFPKIFPPGK